MSALETSQQYRRYNEAIPLANPTVGTDLVFTVSGGLFTRIVSFSLTLTASAAVATRVLRLRMRDGDGRTFWVYEVNPGIAAGVTEVYAGTVFGVDKNGAQGVYHLPLPPCVLVPGYTFGTQVISLQAGDQISSVALYVERWDWTRDEFFQFPSLSGDVDR